MNYHLLNNNHNEAKVTNKWAEIEVGDLTGHLPSIFVRKIVAFIKFIYNNTYGIIDKR